MTRPAPHAALALAALLGAALPAAALPIDGPMEGPTDPAPFQDPAVAASPWRFGMTVLPGMSPAGRGLMVVAIHRGGPADLAGLGVGDVILTAGTTPLQDVGSRREARAIIQSSVEEVLVPAGRFGRRNLVWKARVRFVTFSERAGEVGVVTVEPESLGDPAPVVAIPRPSGFTQVVFSSRP